MNQNNSYLSCVCICFMAASSGMYMEVSFFPTLSCTSMNLATQRSKQMASPLLSSPSLYFGGIHFLWQDLDNLVRQREGCCSIMGASTPSFLFWCSHNFGKCSKTKPRLSFVSQLSLNSGLVLLNLYVTQNLDWKTWVWGSHNSITDCRSLVISFELEYVLD